MDLAKLLESVLPKERIKSRLIDLVAYASDAGFYYLRPKAVVQPVSEEEVVGLFRFSHQYKIPLTFRTAGTSLSGQSITDGILIDLSQHWNQVKVEENGDQVRVRPGAIGAIVNAYLKKHQRKIGPDPSSINSAMMGGILSNNSSGMCCGVSKNSYHTTRYIKFILPDGRSFSTENAADYERFRVECPAIYQELNLIREQLFGDAALYDLIRKKYKTKNTVGYSVNAFLDYVEPLDILAHLMIGAEGTLGFIAEAVLNTVPDYPAKSTALLYFPDIYAACKAIVPLTVTGAEAVELMDRASLRSIENIKGVPTLLKELPEGAAALLVEYQGNNLEELELKVQRFSELSAELPQLTKPLFTTDPQEQDFLWKLRKGMFPAVGAVRASGTTVILEDIAFPVERLGDAILELQQLFKKHHYDNAIIFGHAKDGNIHFVVTQAFHTLSEIERYSRFINDVVNLVVNRFGGTLKAEHGTGRNMAPFVETEWGPEVYAIMKRLKEAIDPENLLNPGVIINQNKLAHLENLKDLPSVEIEVDKCMECGYCEHKCPSRDITLTPRQRIVVRRELVTLKEKGKSDRYKELLDQYQYDGMDTCSVDGMCATACPVDINTGDLIKRLRRESHSPLANKVAFQVAQNFGTVAGLVKFAVSTAAGINTVFGKNAVHNLTKGVRRVVPQFPLWSSQIRPTPAVKKYLQNSAGAEASVVYFPTCISRVMGGSADGKKSMIETFASVSKKAGLSYKVPQEISGMCCGQIFSSKGFSKAFEHSANSFVSQAWNWTQGGKLPVVLDITSCTQTLQSCRPVLSIENREKFDKLRIIDSIDYLIEYILPNIAVNKRKQHITLHPVCSLKKMGLENKFIKIAKHFAEEVEVPLFAGCCGMAGDRGFLFPELTKSATAKEAKEVKEGTFDGYYSSSKTCEINLSDVVGKNYESIIYLVDECC